MRRDILAGVVVTMFAVAACGASPTAEPSAGSTTPPTIDDMYAPTVEPAAFSSTVENPFFPLRPGMRWEYRSNTPDGVETTIVTVADTTKTIMGAPCVEVRDTVTLNGELKEDTLDWYAQHRDGTVWYFGEDTKEYENGKVSSTEGTWTAGIDGALPGIVMPARPQVGDRYRQEYYRGHAEDMAEVQSLTETAVVPAGSYNGAVKTNDYTPLKPDLLENKYYARGVGVVLTVDVRAGGRDELVSFTG